MEQKTIYALGFFDGVHIGHQALLAECCRMADRFGCHAGVVTFANHPDGLVFGKAPPLLNTNADRERLLRQYGIEKILSLPFDQAMMTMPWRDFFQLLVEKYHAAGFVCGRDFRFGDKGLGDAVRLAAACKHAGLPFTSVAEQQLDGVTVSSTKIRSFLEAGDIEKANRFLGHPHLLTGTVVPGRQLGRTIGFPTANLSYPDGLLLPKRGVYACAASVDGEQRAAVTNIGARPTVGGQSVTVEAHLPGFAGDLYGKALTLYFLAFLRPEKKFPALSDLQAEIQKNTREALEFFEKR